MEVEDKYGRCKNPIKLYRTILFTQPTSTWKKHLWVSLMSPASHFFFVQKQKNSADKKYPFANVVKKHVRPYFSPDGKIPRLFKTVSQSYLISLYCMRACDIAFVACNIAFIACVACDIAFVSCVACNKCNIAFVASMY